MSVKAYSDLALLRVITILRIETHPTLAHPAGLPAAICIKAEQTLNTLHNEARSRGLLH